MREAEELCGRIAFIKAGEIIAIGSSEDLKQQTKTENLEEAFIELAHYTTPPQVCEIDCRQWIGITEPKQFCVRKPANVQYKTLGFTYRNWVFAKRNFFLSPNWCAGR